MVSQWILAVVLLVSTLGSIVLGSIGCGLTVSRYTTASLTDARADQIFSSAWSVLDTNDGVNDVVCNVNALWQGRNGAVATFTTGNGIINSKADYDTIVGLGNFVKVVNQINWCGTIAPNWIGCSPQPGSTMIVVRYTDSLEGILWAHEYGHTRNNGHRSDNDAVMNPTITAPHVKVNTVECDNYKK
jgi:hypothetical protein